MSETTVWYKYNFTYPCFQDLQIFLMTCQRLSSRVCIYTWSTRFHSFRLQIFRSEASSTWTWRILYAITSAVPIATRGWMTHCARLITVANTPHLRVKLSYLTVFLNILFPIFCKTYGEMKFYTQCILQITYFVLNYCFWIGSYALY